MPPSRPLLLLAALLIPLALTANDWKTGEVTGKVVEKSDFPCYSLSRDNYTCSACIQFHESCAWCGAPVSLKGIDFSWFLDEILKFCQLRKC
ncbi:hypothetical protein B9Z55_011196 [Caenorhabditis nigoni]|uniref:Uncharacterized protein n=1 Tax=Caenorhabditis nigoni TaxID=1611254 RepID=A0A2G5UJL3_9PELO|nr:hypothetical protein B9Z55_011196 [Caenorhabditis nigoni]